VPEQKQPGMVSQPMPASPLADPRERQHPLENPMPCSDDHRAQLSNVPASVRVLATRNSVQRTRTCHSRDLLLWRGRAFTLGRSPRSEPRASVVRTEMGRRAVTPHGATTSGGRLVSIRHVLGSSRRGTNMVACLSQRQLRWLLTNLTATLMIVLVNQAVGDVSREGPFEIWACGTHRASHGGWRFASRA
jgi:hypothetical protein